MPSTRIYGPSGAPGTAGSVALNTNGATSPVLPLTQVVSSGTETVVLNPALNSATAALVLTIPVSSAMEKMPFKVQASGYIKGATTTNATVKLYSGTSTTVGSDTLLGASSTVAVNSTSAPFFLEAQMIFDSTSGKMQGTIKSSLNNTFAAEAAVSATITSVNNLATTPGATTANFVLSVLFSSANAANAICVQDFCVAF